jgi:FdhD protein
VSRCGAHEVARTRFRRHGAGFSPEPSGSDLVAVEEPLEVRVSGERWLVTMRTPGHDRELCLGLLLAEGIVRERSEVASVAHCGRPGEPGFGNTIEVTLAPGAEHVWRRMDERVRVQPVTAACGVCGRASIDELLLHTQARSTCAPLHLEVLSHAVAQLSRQQPNFELTGGVHAASLVTPEGEPLAVFEDVGRHNAVDKVFGDRLLHDDWPCRDRFLCVSGRASFEIVQKAVVARCAGVISVSAPSSLAVQMAERFNLALVGFARGDSCNVYLGTVVE